MPRGIGRIEKALEKRFPGAVDRARKIRHEYGHTIAFVSGIVLAVILISIILVLRDTRGDVTKVVGDVQVIKQNSPCTPKDNGEAERPKQCRESFSKAVETLTPLQSCQILRKGSTIILIEGRPIPRVTCIMPTQREREVEKEESQKGAESDDRPGNKQNPQGDSSPGKTGGSQNGDKPASDGGSGGNGSKGGAADPNGPVGNPGDGKQGSGGSPSGGSREGQGNDSGGSSGGESGSGADSSDQGGIVVEFLPEVDLPVEPEVCVPGVINVNCEDK